VVKGSSKKEIRKSKTMEGVRGKGSDEDRSERHKKEGRAEN